MGNLRGGDGHKLEQFRKNSLSERSSRSQGDEGIEAVLQGLGVRKWLQRVIRARDEGLEGEIANKPVWKHLFRKKERLKCRQRARRVLSLGEGECQEYRVHWFRRRSLIPCSQAGRIRGS